MALSAALFSPSRVCNSISMCSITAEDKIEPTSAFWACGPNSPLTEPINRLTRFIAESLHRNRESSGGGRVTANQLPRRRDHGGRERKGETVAVN